MRQIAEQSNRLIIGMRTRERELKPHKPAELGDMNSWEDAVRATIHKMKLTNTTEAVVTVDFATEAILLVVLS